MTTTDTTAPTSGGTPPGRPSAERVGVHADQERVARHLAEVTRRRLAGEDDDGSEIVARQPREVVVLGVLAPREPEREDAARPEAPTADIPFEPGVPIDQLPSSEIGLTCLVDTDARELTLDMTAAFAVYVPHFPTQAQQAAYLAGAYEKSHRPAEDDDDEGPDLDRDVATSTDDVTSVQALEADDAPADELPTDEEADAGEGDGGGGDGDNGSGDGGSVSRAAPAAGGRGGRGGELLVPVYRRYDVAVPLTFTVPVPVDSRPVIVAERDTLTLAIRTAVDAGGDGRLAGSAYRLLRGRSQRVPRAVIDAGPDALETYLAGHLAPNWELPLPDLEFHVALHRQGDRVRIALTLANHSARPKRSAGFLPELGVYNASFRALLTGGSFVNMGFALAEEDYRIDPVAYAHGRFCYLDPDCDPAAGEVATTTWPIFRQAVFESRADLQPSYADLASDPIPVLRGIEAEMVAYHDAWVRFLDSGVLDPTGTAACARDRDLFFEELERFRRGIDLLATVPDLASAFQWMNEAFLVVRGAAADPSRTGRPPTPKWRLFQIVFIVANLAALAVRELDLPALIAELEVAEVLWAPTGGGKSDGLFGTVGTAMFYDRLRGKDYGTTALVRFPLRMLSVQQLERVLSLVVACETIRSREEASGRKLGVPFELGYFVGRRNTPNKLTDPSDRIWGDVRAMSKRDAQWKATKVVVPTCCYCGAPTVLEPDVDEVRLHHRCTSDGCGRRLPVMVTDDEVYRYLPTVVVATVDKAATVAWNPHFSHLTHGPRYRCPDHGFVTFAYGARNEKRCLARSYCTRNPTDWDGPLTPKDPAPAFVVQDELHLLSEDLGTFAAHYETLWQWLTTRVAPNLPSKVLAATATIGDYETQVRQLYALRPRRFPTDGYVEGESFYARTHHELARRLFVGALPSQVNTVDFSILAGKTIRGEIERLRALDPSDAVTTLCLRHFGPGDVADVLFAFELQLFYANKKTNADRVYHEMSASGIAGDPAFFDAVRLNGNTPLPEISDAIRRVEHETLTTPPADRLAVIAGTSLVSHGVDLERLNVQFMMGMPPTIAFYVQATSRAGRSGVGLIFCVLSRFHPRDRSVFHFFEPQHAYVNHLVEPVALNRFSIHGPQKTAPGLMAGILINDWARDPAKVGTGRPINFGFAQDFRAWLPRTPAAVEDELRDALHACYGLHAAVLDPHVARQFAERVDHITAELVRAVRGSHESTLQNSMRPKPPTSFRDIDASVEFGSMGWKGREAFGILSGFNNEAADPDAEIDMADEADNT
jgi:hypothetical protein